MPTAPPLTPSGVAAVDARWGGLQTGGTYLVVGAADAGRESLTLQMVRAVVDGGGRCLVLSPRDPSELRTAARAVGLDLAEAHAGGRLRLVRMPAAASLRSRGDDGLDRALDDLTGLVRGDRPDRVVIEDLGPLAGFDDPARLSAALQRFGAALHAIHTTLVVGIAPPPDDAGTQRVAAAESIANGTLRIVTDAGPRRLALSDHRSLSPAPHPSLAEPEAPAPAQPATPAAALAAPAPPAAAPQAAAPQQLPSAPDSARPTPSPLPLPAPPPPAEEPAAPVRALGAVPATALSPPPDADPGLLADATDPFGLDAATSFLNNGFLVDSAAGTVVGHVPAATAMPAAERTPAPTPLERSAFGAELDAAFASGHPFTVVAARMAAASPHAAHFDTVVAGLNDGLGPSDVLHVNPESLRAVALVRSTVDAGPLFAMLQTRVRQSLGERGADVLAAVGAAQIPNGAPFTDAPSLMAYALDQ